MERDRSDHAELDGLATELRELHAEATPAELERARTHAWARAGTPSPQPARRRPRLGRARIAMVSLLAGAFLMAGSGATLALSGISSSGSAGKAQYPLSPTVLPDQDSGGDPGPLALQAPEDQAGELPDTGSGSGTDDPVQPERQVASGGGDGGELPFTGLAALPVLLIGCVLLASGLALRRTSSKRA